MSEAYDIVGDVHGRAPALHRLLNKLGYERSGTHWTQHESRHLIFVGDLIDVGPQQKETLVTVRELMDSGIALTVMGNHEFNAICYATPDQSNAGEFLRSHGKSWGPNNRQQHQAFLDAFDPHGYEYSEWIEWMFHLPLWIETKDLRVVHACWDQACIDRLSSLLSGERLTASQIQEACCDDTALGEDITSLLKGPEIRLPANITFSDRSGHSRDHIRRAWWKLDARTYGEAVLMPAGLDLPDWTNSLPQQLVTTYTDSKPTFFGHYCLNDRSPLLGRRLACLDTCAAREHRLTAYRWEGEAELVSDHLFSVTAGT